MPSDLVNPSVPRFDYPLLLARLGAVAPRFDVVHLDSCTSTNTLLLERAAAGAASGTVLISDEQTAGRGRRGRSWMSSPEHSLTFSLLWKFAGKPQLGGLSLAVGVAIARALEDLGGAGIGLKWPNDVWLFGRKLGGVLIEVLFDATHTGAVIGIGLNLRHDSAWRAAIDQPCAALEEAITVPLREELLAALLRRLAETLDLFALEGFPAIRNDWATRNALRDLPVRVESENGEHVGVCEGVAADGALELRQACGAHLLITAGDVSLRLADAEDRA